MLWRRPGGEKLEPSAHRHRSELGSGPSSPVQLSDDHSLEGPWDQPTQQSRSWTLDPQSCELVHAVSSRVISSTAVDKYCGV